jgi:hypothetical protein
MSAKLSARLFLRAFVQFVEDQLLLGPGLLWEKHQRHHLNMVISQLIRKGL